jgi:hypothetical protein
MPADRENESAKPPAQEGPTRIFLSYARDDDEPFVKRLHDDLTKAGFDVWFDRVSMPSRSSDSSASCLMADGTLVVTQANGQVCFLELHQGNRRVSLAKAEAILALLNKKVE